MWQLKPEGGVGVGGWAGDSPDDLEEVRRDLRLTGVLVSQDLSSGSP